MNIIIITEKQYEYFKYKILIDALEELFEEEKTPCNNCQGQGCTVCNGFGYW
ncbi:hypothetical protein CLV62_1444 [Dysgonomonas alginatilytica]|uniref:Uncharacterized protein n=1 Tax=Dysgonomonas alginatilytica TaxID=1605892 RepID=A0A2V3PKI9_9BACT|nr:hypothetical protein CLV62_1444 [Dysgonomonas alginatilytica]